jgi:hypothetical protein
MLTPAAVAADMNLVAVHVGAVSNGFGGACTVLAATHDLCLALAQRD